MVRKTKLEKEIRKNKLDYNCFRCKEIISIDEKNCPKCEFITIYGNRKKKGMVLSYNLNRMVVRGYEIFPPRTILNHR